MHSPKVYIALFRGFLHCDFKHLKYLSSNLSSTFDNAQIIMLWQNLLCQMHKKCILVQSNDSGC